MRELDSRRLPSRVRGRQALQRRHHALHLAVLRFGTHRARSAAEACWAGRVADGLRALLDTDEPTKGASA